MHNDSNCNGTNTTTLTIQRVKDSDEGYYRCLVKSPVKQDGELSEEAKLTVCEFHLTFSIICCFLNIEVQCGVSSTDDRWKLIKIIPVVVLALFLLLTLQENGKSWLMITVCVSICASVTCLFMYVCSYVAILVMHQ